MYMTVHATDLSLVPTDQLQPLDTIEGFQVRPGFFNTFGATIIPGGVNFTIQSHGATSCELLLFHRMAEEPFAALRFPENYKIGFVYSMIVFGLDIEEFEYAYRLDGPYDEQKGLRFDKTKILLDPYARAVTGQSRWGVTNCCEHGYRARVVRNNFDWGLEKQPQIPMEDLIIYETHVRGFTKDASSGVCCPGTFLGLNDKIPYLKELGINAVELMPVFEFDEMRDVRVVDDHLLIDYWGYNSVCFFAPNTSYASSIEYNREGRELKELIKALHDNGIDVILDVVFNHTAEGNELGPSFCFKGFDNNIYYMLTPDGYYYNFSGCGNTLNCNHPVVQQLILDCLRYWVTDYRVDGFRFDLASILGRNEDGSPMNQPPLLRSLAFDPILGTVKLIAEAWDAGGLYQVGSFPSWRRWAEWNGKYRDDMRRFLKGDGGLAEAAAQRMLGSPDLYDPASRGLSASVNFITCHDGFTLNDLYSYNEKHNEANGWNNTDGSNDNNSWNCGVEGETDNPEVLALRLKMMRNACAVLMCSRGTPMFLAGDEFGDTRFGNNNPYCQDNEISWLDWSLLETNQELFGFFRYMIAFRKKHRVIRKDLDAGSFGFPNTSIHGLTPWTPDTSPESRTVCVMFAGFDAENQKEDVVYVAVNPYWRTLELVLPELPDGVRWHIAVNTGDPAHTTFPEGQMPMADGSVLLGGRSVIVFVAE
ncbi:MAG: glycogen debranching protein GlgX [Faecalicatena sp.]|uniref:glycogen debranching protein GlgX n=1 Tax=Faecalicatena sp. TaxID=2005360 RepID=UPI00258DD4D5|nr:glycogen debranching protein GlgX [Faecalicatena sp.]MCI6468019.1 glycogen debranching protein GlgX [Faecalicatena sp.]MDY5618496.1 glycogen debranching protein GlgX [Lachnospiraceae bacterium]